MARQQVYNYDIFVQLPVISQYRLVDLAHSNFPWSPNQTQHMNLVLSFLLERIAVYVNAQHHLLLPQHLPGDLGYTFGGRVTNAPHRPDDREQDTYLSKAVIDEV